MRVLTDAASAREFSRRERLAGKLISLVPTMGYLHDGHLTLVKEAKSQSDVVIVSIYVNPTQFSANEDFGVYPKALARDHQLLSELGVDAIFQPKTLYATASHNTVGDAASGSGDAKLRPGDHETFVQVELLQQPLCGKSRPHFFRGVATVVTKLFNIVEPDVAFFGSKDYQQLQVIKRMVRDLDFGIDIVGLPIVREADGLAMSSRNALLSEPHRAQAPQIYQALKVAQAAAVSSEVRRARDIEEQVMQHLSGLDCRVDYVEVVDASTLEQVEDVRVQPAILAVAVFMGSVRLIDNISL